MARTKRKTKFSTTSNGNRRFRQAGIKPENGGPGGWDCNCCGEPRGKRDALFRKVRRIEKNNLRNIDLD